MRTVSLCSSGFVSLELVPVTRFTTAMWQRNGRTFDLPGATTRLQQKKKYERVQVATLLTTIGEQARDVFSTFDWPDAESKSTIGPVLQKFADYCQPRKNWVSPSSDIALKSGFRKRVRATISIKQHYGLRKLAEGCEFDTITAEEIFRDRLIFGIREVKLRERLLRESQLTFQKTDEICRASESTAKQQKEVSEGDTVNSVNFRKKSRRPRGKKGDTDETTKACSKYGWIHETNTVTVLLVEKHTVVVANLIISPPYVVVESVETPKTTQALRLLSKSSVQARTRTNYMWLATLQPSRLMTHNSSLYGFNLGTTYVFSRTLAHSATSSQFSCTRKLLMFQV